jgi:ribonuclease G
LIADLLREGQEILVQVSKEPLGKKGARITSHIALPGRYLVYMPTVDHIGVSRKIASDEERQRLKRVINENRTGLPGGFIVRTAAEGRAETEFVNDIRFLGNLWSDIRAKSEKKSGPALIHSDLTLVQRMLRDQLTEEFKAIRIDNEQEFATILDFVNKFQPALVNRVRLHVKDTPIFEEFGLNAEIDKALKSKVWLKSGGYIVINQTEALVAIDINTGKYVGKSNRLEDTITRTNVDAVHEIVRQIRLRNLGGIIVVDFIDMEERKNRQKVMAALEEELRSDRVPSKILQFNDFGLVAITRKRTQASLERTICTPCDHCSGSGWVKSPETICYEIQSELRKMSSLLEGKEITVRVNPQVAKVLKSGEFVSLIDMEEMLKKNIVVKSDPLLHEEHFDIF